MQTTEDISIKILTAERLVKEAIALAKKEGIYSAYVESYNRNINAEFVVTMQGKQYIRIELEYLDDEYDLWEYIYDYIMDKLNFPFKITPKE